jgi:predicted ATPase
MYLRTLGGLRLEGSSFRRPKPLLLLAYLALEGSKPRRYLAELFFMEASDSMNSLSRALSYLRQEAPGVIEADHKKVWATVGCDATELLNLTDTRQFEKSLELYKGAFALDYDLELSEELEEWLYGTREILAAKARQAFLMLGESEAGKGNFAQAAQLAEKAYRLKEAAELEPDDFARVYNLLYAGNSPLAAEVRKEAEGFEIPLELSREETKAQLSETLEIENEIPNNLPPPKTSFIGRDQELIEIAQQLAKKDCRLLTLHGMGGIGKSRLAIQAAYDQIRPAKGSSSLFKDGVYFVALDALSSAELIPSSIAEALGLELQGQEDTLTQVKRFIGKKHILLLLDNYEHLMTGAILTSELLQACPNLKLLVTSRERLNIEEEWVLTLDGLAVPTFAELTEAERFDALNLFIQRAKRAMLEFSLTQETLPHALKICQLVEGSPLGIELAAVWVKTLPVSEIAKEIESNLSVLEAPTRNMAERHQSIRAVFEHSWKLLTYKEQEVLRKLSVFIGGFRREAASEVSGATLPILAILVDKSLLRVSENGRYERHPLLYQYAKEKLSTFSDESEQAQNSHGQYFLEFVYIKHSTPTLFIDIDVEISNILQAIETSIEKKDHNYIVKMMNMLVMGESYFTARGYNLKLLKFIYLAVESAKSIGDLEAAHYLVAKLGDAYRESIGDFEKALEAFTEALELARQCSNTHREAHMLSLIGIVMFQQGREEAESYLEKAHKIAVSVADNLMLSRILQHKAYIHSINQNWTEARTLYTQSVEVAKRLKKTEANSETTADRELYFAFLNLGELERTVGNHKQALELCQKCLSLANKYDNQLWRAFALQNIGEVYHGNHQKHLANTYYNQALSLYKQNQVAAEIAELEDFMAKENYILKESVA